MRVYVILLLALAAGSWMQTGSAAAPAPLPKPVQGKQYPVWGDPDPNWPLEFELHGFPCPATVAQQVKACERLTEHYDMLYRTLGLITTEQYYLLSEEAQKAKEVWTYLGIAWHHHANLTTEHGWKSASEDSSYLTRRELSYVRQKMGDWDFACRRVPWVLAPTWAWSSSGTTAGPRPKNSSRACRNSPASAGSRARRKE